MENLKEWEDTTKNKSLNILCGLKIRIMGYIVRFDGLTVGEVVYGFKTGFLIILKVIIGQNIQMIVNGSK